MAVSSRIPAPEPGAGRRPCRDLLVFGHGDELVVVAVDSAGGVGPKQADSVRVQASVVGRLTARVALMEVLACGARPRGVALCSCNEPRPVAEELREGVLEEMACAGLSPGDLVMSSEKNFPTVQTGVGVTAIGTVRREDFRPGSGRPGDTVLLVGRPKVGAEVRADDAEAADLQAVILALALPGVSDLVPVGSGGAGAEARVLAEPAGLEFWPAYPEGLDPRASAGPATALLIAAAPESVEALGSLLAPRPCREIGRLLSCRSSPGAGGGDAC